MDAEKASNQSDVKELEFTQPATNVQSISQEVEPEFHARTWIALAAFFLLNYVQVVALQGPSAMVCVDSEPREHATDEEP